MSGRAASPNGIIFADVLARVELLRMEVEEIRFEMGKPKESRTTRVATDATSHETYFQALTLFLKAGRLALELNGSTGVPPMGVSPLRITPYHVWGMVNAAYERILTVKRELRIAASFAERPADPLTTATDVARAIVETNRQLNLMLDRRFAPSDVSQQVSVAIGYASILLEQFPEKTLTPKPPAFERGKQPRDVMLRLLGCYKRIEAIAKRSDLEVLKLDSSAAKKISVIRPGDVYDLATLIVSDLAYLRAHLQDADHPKLVPYPGRKFPSHVYQQAGILKAQLEALLQHVRANPGWLAPKDGLGS